MPVVAADFELLSGTTRIYEKRGASGHRNQQHFCGHCASPIYATLPDADPRVFNLRLGTARQRDQLVPKAQHWALIGRASRIDTQ